MHGTPSLSTGTVTLRNARVPAAAMGSIGNGSVASVDIEIVDGRIAAIRPTGSAPITGPSHDMDKGLVLPAFVDIHTHLDKGQIWPRKENPDGSWMGALLAVANDRDRLWAAEDVERRFDFALRCAYAHGTAAIRSHLDSAPPQHEISWALFEKMRDKWAGRIELQACAIVGPDTLVTPHELDTVARQVKATGGLLGGSVATFDRSKEAMLRVVEKAGDLGLDLDLHTDETGNPQAHALLHLAEAVLETGYKGKVMAGHCCVLTVQDELTVRTTIDKAVEAGIAIVSLPMCNIYLQDRENGNGRVRTPLRRGATLLNEFKAAGAVVAIASDNTRDPFYAYGDLDGVEVLREGARILQFDHPQDLAWDWVRAVGSAPAAHAGFKYKAVIEAGAPADLVLFHARSWTELNSRPQADRIVLRSGRAIDTTLPDYRELDDLMSNKMNLEGFRAALGDIPVEDNPRIVQQKSRDHYWYSPRLKSQLEGVTAQLVVSPRSTEEVVTALKAAFANEVPITPRGAGTGNYGQAMPLSGGAMLSLTNMDKVIKIEKDRVRAEAGVILEKLDEETTHAVNGEMRFHPSTYRMATLGGFIAGGSGGVGSIRWGGLRNFGNILGLKVVTCEAEPRVLDLKGPDILKVAHAYGTNGIIVEAEMPLTAHYDWVDMMVGFDTILEACAFAEQVARQDGLLCKEISPVAAPVAHDYFNRHRPYIRSREQSVVLLMVAPAAVPAMVDFVEFHKGDMLLNAATLEPEAKAKLPPIYELAWNHTTLRGLKIDPTITYLQTQYPDLAHVKWAVDTFGDEMPMHIEMTRFDGRIVFSGLPIVRYKSEERLEEIIRLHEENGCLVFNPHRYTLEEGGMKRTDRAQLQFKKEADPKGILNPGKMIAWDDPDFDFESGRTWLFTGLYTLGTAAQ